MIDSCRGPRRAVVALAAAVLLPVLAACTVNIGTTAASSSSSAAGSTARAPAPSQPGGVTADQSAAPGQNNVARVSCSGSACTVTLAGSSRLTVLGTTFSLTSIQGGRATLDVGGQSVSCAQGESVSSGPITLQCTAVTADSVSFTATRA
jgi:hypothetical protein